MLASLLTLATLVTCRAQQAAWPQVGKDSEHSRRGDASWPRSSQVTLQPFVTFPLNTPLLIGQGDTLYGGSVDGNIYAVSKTGEVLWTLYLSGGDCGYGFFLNEPGTLLFCNTLLPGNARLQVVDVTTTPPKITSDTLLPQSTLSAVGEGALILSNENLTCFSASDVPTQRWSVSIGPYFDIADASIHKNHLYVLDFSGMGGNSTYLTAYDLFSGTELWRVSFPTIAFDFGENGHMIISDYSVVVDFSKPGENLELYSYDHATGKPLWSLPSLLKNEQWLSLSESGSIVSPRYTINSTNGDVTPFLRPALGLVSGDQILDQSGALFFVGFSSTAFLYGYDTLEGVYLFSPLLLTFETIPEDLGLAMASDGTLFVSSKNMGVYVVTPASLPSPSPYATPSTSPTPPFPPPPASFSTTPSGLATTGWATLGSFFGILAGGGLLYCLYHRGYLKGRTDTFPLQPQLAGGDYISVQY